MAEQQKPQNKTMKHPNGTTHKVASGSEAEKRIKAAQAAAKAKQG